MLKTNTYALIIQFSGPMFSGKSTELMRRIKRYKIATFEVLVIKYAKDDRYHDEYAATHDGKGISTDEKVNGVHRTLN